MKSHEWIRYETESGLWIPYRKRTYLYWFKFLQEAERCDEVTVNWNKYRGWGGANVVLGQKFDEWWNDRWKDLFGYKKGTDLARHRFPLTTTTPKTETIRMALLVWQHRNIAPDWEPRLHSSAFRGVSGGSSGAARMIKRRGSNALALGRKINQIEKRPTSGKWGLVEGDSFGGWYGSDDAIRQLAARWKKRGRTIVETVSEGQFPGKYR